MIPLREIVARCRRANHEENLWIFPFSGRAAKYFTWVFVNLGISANQVTVVFWLCGLGAAAAALLDTPAAAVATFFLLRLHILFDVCDGEVARYRGTLSRFGVYWDQVIHVFTYPLILACLGLGRLLHGAAAWVVAAAMLAMICRALDVALKNIYLRTIYQAGETLAPPGTPSAAGAAMGTAAPGRPGRGPGRRLLSLAVRLSSYDALILFYAVASFLPPVGGFVCRDLILAAYSLAFLALAEAEVVLIPRRGGLPMRKDLR